MSLNMKMDFKASKYSFSENRFKLGTMSIGVKGDVALPSDADMMMDIEFQSIDMSIKSILSLLPGDHSSYIDNVIVQGDVRVFGNVSGTYNELFPDINISTIIDNGYLVYKGYYTYRRDSIGS